MKKRVNKVFRVVFALGIVFLLTACEKTVDVKCVWCGKSPSVEYTTANGNKSYVCEKCSKNCMICGREEATHHYTNMLDAEIFVGDNCYDKIQAESK